MEEDTLLLQNRAVKYQVKYIWRQPQTPLIAPYACFFGCLEVTQFLFERVLHLQRPVGRFAGKTNTFCLWRRFVEQGRREDDLWFQAVSPRNVGLSRAKSPVRKLIPSLVRLGKRK